MNDLVGLVDALAARIAQEFAAVRNELFQTINQASGGGAVITSSAPLDGGGAQIVNPIILDGGGA